MGQLVLPEGYIDAQGRLMGLHLNMPEAAYHGVKAFSYSGAKEFQKSPAHFKALQSKEWEIDPKREKYKAVHILCLEPELHSRIVVRDGRWSGDLKKEVQALQREGKIVVKQDDYDEALEIAASIKRHSLANLILQHSICEVSIFAEIDGVYCKGRIDDLAILPNGICLGDLKNFGDVSNEKLIGHQIARNFYHWQMGFYSKLIETVFGKPPIRRYWKFVEESPPHGVKIRNCNEAMAEAGWLGISQLLPKFKECLEDDTWPNYAEDEQDADLPDWAFAVVGDEQ